MKVKHTKLKKSIFLILICISLTTTFVVSASAVETDSTVTLNYPGGSLSFPFQYDNEGYNQYFQIIFFPFDIEIDGVSVSANTSFMNFSFGSDFNQQLDYPLSPIFFSGFVDSYSFFVPSDGTEHLYVPLFYDESPDGILQCNFSADFDVPLDYTITFNSPSSSPSFLDRVTSGLTSSLSWVGQVVESLTTGPIKPLLECFAVTISVSALLLGIYSIRKFIWGS